MANIHVTLKPLVARGSYPANTGNAAVALRSAKKLVAPQVATAFEAGAAAFSNVQGSLNKLWSTLQQNTQSVQQFLVTDNTGKVLAALGDFEYNGVVTPNYFSEIHVGDPLNTGDPSQALFNAANGKVTIGQNGAIDVLDPFGGDAAWIGAQADTEPVTGAVDNGSGLIRLTITSHTYSTGDTPTFKDVGGVPNATGIFTVTSVDANHVDLQNSVFVGTYTSGGTGTRILHLTGAANNGSGLIRIQTAVAHTYETGDKVNIPSPGPGGVSAAMGQWVITVVDSTHFDLQGSTFSGTYTTGGTCLRYFAGMLAQTFAIGPSFPNYKLRAFADGSLRINDASISVTAQGPPATTVSINSGQLGIVISDNNVGSATTTIRSSGISITQTEAGDLSDIEIGTGGGFPPSFITMADVNGVIRIYSDVTNGIRLFDASNTLVLTADLTGAITAAGDIQTSGVYKKGANSGLSVTRSFGTSVSLNTVSNAVNGTPGAGQGNFTAVTNVTLNTTANTFSGGIITA
jgi:hypothetical protein